MYVFMIMNGEIMIINQKGRYLGQFGQFESV